MSLWNPYAFTPTGQPVAPAAPPALRVIGGPASAQQMQMAQHAFAQFCMNSRLSVVPNPVEDGRLPDGTPYKIIDVSGVRTMMIWPTSGENLLSGVAIALSDLDQNALPGFSTDGFPNLYLLTPESTSNRESTGKWKVRKLSEPLYGGKAVNSSPDGKKYFTGIEGSSDYAYPINYGNFGSLNERAYYRENRQVLSIRKNGEDVFLSNNADSPIPFILQQDDKEYVAQLVFRRVYDGNIKEFVDLYVGPPKKTPGVPVGELVYTLEFPPNVEVDEYTVSIRNDGREARATGRDATRKCNITIHIAKDSLDYTLSGYISDATYQYDYAPIVEVYNGENTETYISNYRRTNGNYLDSDGTIKGKTGKTTINVYRSNIFAFGPKGQEIDFTTSGLIETIESRYDEESYYFASLLPGGTSSGWSRRESYERRTYLREDSDISQFVGASSEAAVYLERTSQLNSVQNASGTVYDGTLIESRLEYYGAISSIFYDRYQQFAVFLDIVPPGNSSILRASGSSETFYPESTSRTPGKVVLKIKYKSDILKSEELVVTSEQPGTFIAYAASDPKTAAIVVNIMRVRRMSNGINKRLASWIYLVDETGVKELKDVMPGLPDNACAKENRLLYSV